MSVITRFAPSPTGFLHIGGARTALFNWLYARHHGGKMLLRIEDTDRERSKEEAILAIINGMKWMGLDWDGEAVSQFSQKERHQEVAQKLLDEGKAYYCYATPEELDEMREQAKKEKRPMRYDGRWRDRDPKEAPKGVDPVIRLKVDQSGETVIQDLVQGEVKVSNVELDDMVLVRSDGTPTYMLAVVVDDHDMAVTHVIRGDDHLTNAFRQFHIYKAMGWDIPTFAHIPLIHGPDGAKLSKRHGALGVEAYQEMGYLPEALMNYLLRLGWSHGDEEIISTEQAIQWFDFDHVGKSPARFDLQKLENLNGHYIRESSNESLVDLIVPILESELGKVLTSEARDLLLRGMEGLKQRAKTIVELAQSSGFYVYAQPIPLNEKAQAILTTEAKALIGKFVKAILERSPRWNHEALLEFARGFAEQEGIKLKDLAQPLRAAITGSNVSPGVFEVMEVLGQEKSLERLSL